MPSRKKKTATKEQPNNRTITFNRQATFNYEILDRFEAGLALTGTEIKSIRAGKVDLRDAYARPQNGELWLLNSHIAQYDPASIFNHEPRCRANCCSTRRRLPGSMTRYPRRD